MEKIKAIPTRYKGYHFRSRLEARWAVFFDALGIIWEYETEGVQLEDGTKYLPDFELFGVIKGKGTRSRLFVEVKPYGGFSAKASKAHLETGMQIVLLDGTPGPRPYRLVSGQPDSDVMDLVLCFAPGTMGRDPVMSATVRSAGGLTAFLQSGGEIAPGLEVDLAIRAARSARFEFGQEGAA